MDTPPQERNFGILLVGITIAFIWVLTPLFGPVLWSLVLALIFYPTYQFFSKYLPHRSFDVAGIATILIVVAAVIAPFIFISTELASETSALIDHLKSNEIGLAATIKSLTEKADPWERQLLHWLDLDNRNIQSNLADGVIANAQTIAKSAFGIGQSTLENLGRVFVMLYLTFFFLHDHKQLAYFINNAIPLEDERKATLLNHFVVVARATVKGSMIIAAVQAALGGVAFLILGIRAPLLWASVMFFLSLLPVVGPALVWGPVALYLTFQGAYGSALSLTAFGVLVIGLVDNVLRPILVGRDTKIPDYVILATTLGALIIFGVNGIVMGPLIAAVFLSAWRIRIKSDIDDAREASLLLPSETRSDASGPRRTSLDS